MHTLIRFSVRKSASLVQHLCQRTAYMAREVEDISSNHLSQLPNFNEVGIWVLISYEENASIIIIHICL